MVVMAPREKWTDERLDDLNEKVDKGFERTERAIAETKAEIAKTQTEMREGFVRVDGEIKELRREMYTGFDKMNDRFDRLSQILIGGAIAIVVALIGLIGVTAL